MKKDNTRHMYTQAYAHTDVSMHNVKEVPSSLSTLWDIGVARGGRGTGN